MSRRGPRGRRPREGSKGQWPWCPLTIAGPGLPRSLPWWLETGSPSPAGRMGVFGAGAGRARGARARWLSPAVSRSCCLSPAGLGVSCCSYLWIVPITSVKNGIQQTDYWLPGTAQGNPAVP